MKILVFANANSVWIYNLFLLFQDDEIEMTLWSPYRIESYYHDKYEELGIRVIESPEIICSYLEKNRHTIVRKVLFLLALLRFVYRVLKMDRWDIVNVHYVDPHLLRVFAFFPSAVKKLVLSYWGSDLLRESIPALMRVKNVVRKSLGCTFENDNLKCMHESVYSCFPDRKVVMLPLPLLDDIDRNEAIKNAEYVIVDGQRIDRKKVAICVGYNGRRQQQHDRVLEQLERLDDSIKEQVVLLFPFTYSVDKNDTYIDDVKKQIELSGIDSHIFERMLPDDELAKLRLITDVFINSQTTDSFSGSVCEVLYAGGTLVNPQWLHYSELDLYKLEYIEYTAFGDLTELIKDIVSEYDRTDISEHNRDIMKYLRSMEQCKVNWKEYFLGVTKE